MSSLRVHQIVNLNDDGPVEFSTGVTLPGDVNITGDGKVAINAGIVTANKFSGDGSGVTFPGFLTTRTMISVAFYP